MCADVSRQLDGIPLSSNKSSSAIDRYQHNAKALGNVKVDSGVGEGIVDQYDAVVLSGEHSSPLRANHDMMPMYFRANHNMMPLYFRANAI